MKKKTTFALVGMMIFLLGCTPVFSVATKTPSVFTPPLGTQASLSPSPPPGAPTEAPTVLPTPTENPLAGAPEGTTGKNSKGEWIKTVTENNESITYVYKTVTDPKRNEVLAQGWYKDIIVNPTYQGGIPIAVEPTPVGAMHIWCEEGLQCPTIQHIDNPNYADNVNTNYNREIETIMFRRLYGSALDAGPFYTDLGNGKISYSFTVDGISYTYKIRPESSMNIYLKKSTISNPDFSNGYIQASISGDDNGNVNVVEYISQSLVTMTPVGFVRSVLTYPFLIFKTEDMSQESAAKYWDDFTLSAALSSGVHGLNPYFIITH